MTAPVDVAVTAQPAFGSRALRSPGHLCHPPAARETRPRTLENHAERANAYGTGFLGCKWGGGHGKNSGSYSDPCPFSCSRLSPTAGNRLPPLRAAFSPAWVLAWALAVPVNRAAPIAPPRRPSSLEKVCQKAASPARSPAIFSGSPAPGTLPTPLSCRPEDALAAFFLSRAGKPARAARGRSEQVGHCASLRSQRRSGCVDWPTLPCWPPTAELYAYLPIS